MSPSLAEASPSGLPPAPSRRQAGRIKPKMRLGLEKGVGSAGIIEKGKAIVNSFTKPDKGDGPLTAKAA